MRYKVGAEQLQQSPPLVPRPGTVFQVARTAPVGVTHAVSIATGATACGTSSRGLVVLNEDWEAACFVEKCPRASPLSAPTKADAALHRLDRRRDTWFHTPALTGGCLGHSGRG